MAHKCRSSDRTKLGNNLYLSLAVFYEELPMALKEQLKADLRIAFGKYLEETEDHPLKKNFPPIFTASIYGNICNKINKRSLVFL